MKNLHWIAIAGLFLSSCEATLRDGWSVYLDGGLGKYGMSGLMSVRKEIPGGQESWYFIPYINWEKRSVGLIQNHGVSYNIYP